MRGQQYIGINNSFHMLHTGADQTVHLRRLTCTGKLTGFNVMNVFKAITGKLEANSSSDHIKYVPVTIFL